MKRILDITVLATLIVAPACGTEGPDGKGPEELFPDGKDDSFRNPTVHDWDWREFGKPSSAEITAEEKFHFWSFYLYGPADLVLETQPASSGSEVDTVMYLYRNDPGNSSWGPSIAKNDDYGDSLWSRLELHHTRTEPTEYAVWVKGYDADVRGAFTFLATCSGTCKRPDPPPGTDCTDLDDYVGEVCLSDDDDLFDWDDWEACLISIPDEDLPGLPHDKAAFARNCCATEGTDFYWCYSI